tara:strand:- start:1714 stop:2310 length:597 start_codon:yes stop_codon:yes gene_type:complete
MPYGKPPTKKDMSSYRKAQKAVMKDPKRLEKVQVAFRKKHDYQGTKKTSLSKPKPKPVDKPMHWKELAKLVPKDNQAQLNEENREGDIIKRTIVSVDDLFDAVVKPLEKKGYSFTKRQLEDIQGVVTAARNLPNENKGAFYGTGPKKGQRIPPKTTTGEVTENSFWYIKPAKGKTEMMIIYTGRNDKKSMSVRVKKKK